MSAALIRCRTLRRLTLRFLLGSSLACSPLLSQAASRVLAWGGGATGQTAVPAGLTNVVAVSGGGFGSLALRADGSIVSWGDVSFGGWLQPDLSNVVAIAAGGVATSALRQDGTVAVWGFVGEWPQLSDVVAIACGWYHVRALREDGTVVAWGDNGWAQEVPTGLDEVTAIAAGGYHSLALRRDGTVVAWGYIYDGWIGMPDPIPAGLGNVVAVSAGHNHGVALRADGTVAAWGRSDMGQTSVPPGLTGVRAIAAGGDHTLALRLDGTIVAWGRNDFGQASVPEGMSNVVAIAAGTDHSLALCVDAPLVLRPTFRDERVVAGTTVHLRPTIVGAAPMAYQWRLEGVDLPGAHQADLSFEEISPGQSGTYTVAISNSWGEAVSPGIRLQVDPLRIESGLQQRTAFVGDTVDVRADVVGSGPFEVRWYRDGMQLDGFEEMALVLTNVLGEDAGLYRVEVANRFGRMSADLLDLGVSCVTGWGGNEDGQATAPPGLEDIVQVAGGRRHSLALRRDGTVVAWGDDRLGQTRIPTGLDHVVAIAAGPYHSTALRSDGCLVAWGWGEAGQLEGLDRLSGLVAVAHGERHSLALGSDGRVMAWGDNAYGQAQPPADLGAVVSIAAGGCQSMALTREGRLVGWGDYAPQGEPMVLREAVAIACGVRHSLALTAEGRVVAWGDNTSGQTNVPAGLSNVVQIAAGAQWSIALRADGTVVAWGPDHYGEVAVPDGLRGVGAVAAGEHHALVIGGALAPWMASSMSDRTVVAGAGATLHAAFTGRRPLWYQWQYEGVDLTGATNATLELSQVQPGQTGRYSVVVSNSDGSSSSSRVWLQVEPLAITRQPQSQLGVLGTPVEFSSAAEGAGPFAYQWSRDGTDLPGATNDFFTIPGVQRADAGGYRVRVSGPFGVVESALARLAVSELVAWGRDARVPEDGVTNVVAVVAGERHQWALGADGKVFGWSNDPGGSAEVPSALRDVVGLASAGNRNLALRSDGTVVGWSTEGTGGAVPDSWTNMVAMAVGGVHALAVRADGRVVGWGENSWGETDVPGDLESVVAVAAGEHHSLALRRDGVVVGWGRNDAGQTDIPPGLGRVVGIAASGNTSFGVAAEGHVVAWGDGSLGQLLVPSSLTNAVDVSASVDHVLARDSTGGLWAWGADGWGQATVPEGLADVAAMAAGPERTLAVLGRGAPFLTSALPDRWVGPGVPTVLQATVVGATPVAFQWYLNGEPLGAEIWSEGTTSELEASHAGRYRVRVRNGFGEIVSREAVLASEPLRILGELPDQVVGLGGVAAWEVLVSGPGPFTYQWEFNGGAIPGATNRSLHLAAMRADQAGAYAVTVSSPWDTVRSAAAQLTVRWTGRVVAWANDAMGVLIVPDLGDVVAVSAGSEHALALRADGTVRGWGWNEYEQATVPAGLGQVVQVSAGYRHSLALRADGTVVAWGTMTVPAGLSNIVAVAAGIDYSLALKDDGTVMGWALWENPAAVPPPGLADVVAIGAGEDFAVGLRADGSLVTWGNSLQSRGVDMTPPPDVTHVVAVAAGVYHCLALSREGIVKAWGNSMTVTVPERLRDVVAIGAGSLHSVALTADGQVVTWGVGAPEPPAGLEGLVNVDAGSGYCLALSWVGPPVLLDPRPWLMHLVGGQIQLRIRTQGGPIPAYQWTVNGVDLPGATNAVLTLDSSEVDPQARYAVRVRNAHGISVSAERTVGERPLAVVVQPRSCAALAGTPATFSVGAEGPGPFSYQWEFEGRPLTTATNAVLTLPEVWPEDAGRYAVTVSNGREALRSAEAVLAVNLVAVWGEGRESTPMPPDQGDIVGVAAGGSHDLALKRDGAVLAWGENWLGQLDVPTDLTNVVGVAAGYFHSVALLADGSLRAWGGPPFQIELPLSATNIVALAGGLSGGTNHNLALRADGTIVGWGDNRDGQLDLPSDLGTVIGVGAGGRHSAALRADGTVAAWGNNDWGQTNVPSDLPPIVAIACGQNHTLGLTAEGRVVGWGDGRLGQLAIPDEACEVVAVAAGDRHNLALRLDGTVVGWGDNTFGGPALVPAGLRNVVAIAAGGNHSLALVGRPTPPPEVSDPRTVDGQWWLSVSTVRGRRYRLEFRDTLSESTWMAVPLPAIPGNAQVRSLGDPSGQGRSRFYRIRVE